MIKIPNNTYNIDDFHYETAIIDVGVEELANHPNIDSIYICMAHTNIFKFKKLKELKARFKRHSSITHFFDLCIFTVGMQYFGLPDVIFFPANKVVIKEDELSNTIDNRNYHELIKDEKSLDAIIQNTMDLLNTMFRIVSSNDQEKLSKLYILLTRHQLINWQSTIYYKQKYFTCPKPITDYIRNEYEVNSECKSTDFVVYDLFTLSH